MLILIRSRELWFEVEQGRILELCDLIEIDKLVLKAKLCALYSYGVLEFATSRDWEVTEIIYLLNCFLPKLLRLESNKIG